MLGASKEGGKDVPRFRGLCAGHGGEFEAWSRVTAAVTEDRDAGLVQGLSGAFDYKVPYLATSVSEAVFASVGGEAVVLGSGKSKRDNLGGGNAGWGGIDGEGVAGHLEGRVVRQEEVGGVGGGKGEEERAGGNVDGKGEGRGWQSFAEGRAGIREGGKEGVFGGV